jgi:molybdopterin converting factor small subunit
VRGITALLREKIKAQEAMLEKDKAILRALEERYRGM